MFIKRDKLQNNLQKMIKKLCAYGGGERCDCKYGAKNVGKGTELGNGCPEIRQALSIISAMTDVEYERACERSYIAIPTTKKQISFEEFVEEISDKGLFYSEEDCIKCTWSMGGTGGGSCWDEGESNHYGYEGDPEPNFDALNSIFELYYPDISYIKYQAFCKDNVKYDSKTNYEYYGNSSTTGEKSVAVSQVYNFLRKNGKL